VRFELSSGGKAVDQKFLEGMLKSLKIFLFVILSVFLLTPIAHAQDTLRAGYFEWDGAGVGPVEVPFVTWGLSPCNPST